MKPTEFVSRLNAISFKGDLDILERAEDVFSERMETFRGYDALAIAFMRFFLDTVPASDKQIEQTVTKPITGEHLLFLNTLVHSFVSLRAARTMAHSGYPLQAFTLLRNIYDDCLLASAVVQGLTTFDELAGAKPNETLDFNRMRKNRKLAERKVRAKMEGADSGLSSDVRDHLKKMDQMYDMETHGGRLSMAFNLLVRAHLSVVPVFREDEVTLYLNRYLETAWMVHRLLPLGQLVDAAPSKEWGSKWRVIDESFNYVVMSLYALGKPFFKSVCEFVAIKFPFNDESRFPA
jgi:hypothetical protein